MCYHSGACWAPSAARCCCGDRRAKGGRSCGAPAPTNAPPAARGVVRNKTADFLREYTAARDSHVRECLLRWRRAPSGIISKTLFHRNRTYSGCAAATCTPPILQRLFRDVRVGVKRAQSRHSRKTVVRTPCKESAALLHGLQTAGRWRMRAGSRYLSRYSVRDLEAFIQYREKRPAPSPTPLMQKRQRVFMLLLCCRCSANISLGTVLHARCSQVETLSGKRNVVLTAACGFLAPSALQHQFPPQIMSAP